jgi:hypothetical protein
VSIVVIHVCTTERCHNTLSYMTYDTYLAQDGVHALSPQHRVLQLRKLHIEVLRQFRSYIGGVYV